LIPPILQLSGAILLAILIFLRNEKQSIRATISITLIQGKKNPKIKETIKETWVIRFGLLLVIVGYILQILNIDSILLIEASRIYKLVYTTIITTLLVLVLLFICSKIADYKFRKITPFDKDIDNDVLRWSDYVRH